MEMQIGKIQGCLFIINIKRLLVDLVQVRVKLFISWKSNL